MLRLLLLPAVAVALLPAAATTGRPDPLNPRAEVPAPRLPGALRDRRPAITPEPGDWRQANDQVARIGGWKTYLREAQQPDAPATPAGAAAAPPEGVASASAAPPAPQPRRGAHAHDHR